MAGFRNSGSIDVLFVDNVDFTGAAIPSPQMLADGQLIIGSTAAPNMKIATLTAGSGIAITNGSGSITIALQDIEKVAAPYTFLLMGA